MASFTQTLSGWFGGGGLPTAKDGDSRTSVMFPQVPGEREISAYDRKRINQKGKYVVSTLGIGRALSAGVSRYVTPINPYPATDDPEYNKRAREAWENWATSKIICDIRQTSPYRKLQRQGCNQLFRAGEYFNHYVRTAGSLRPKIQMLDDTQIDGRPTITARYPDEFVDGIRYSKSRAPIGYVHKMRDGKREILNRQKVTHCYDPERIGQGRGITWLYAGANSAVDMLDLSALEKETGKLHSALAAVVKTRSGDDGGKGLGRNFKELADKIGMGELAGMDKKHPLLNELKGMMVKYLNLDEEVQLLSSNRQSMVWAGFMDYIARDVAASFGVPVEFVWAMAGLNGANTRTILKQAQTFISDVQDLLVDMEVRETYVKVIASEQLLWFRTNGQQGLEPGTDPRWWLAEYHGPAHVSIDDGKDTKSDVERLKHGMLAIPDYWRNRNKDPNRQRTIQLDWLEQSMKECEERNIPLSLYFSTALPGQTEQQDQEKEKPEDEDDTSQESEDEDDDSSEDEDDD